MVDRAWVLTSGVPAALAAALPGACVLPVIEDDDRWVARTSLDIAPALAASPAPGMVLVFAGATARHAPFIGFAQRAARRTVTGYVLVDPELPRPGVVGDWPDAPVIVVVSEDGADRAQHERDARLRDWEVIVGDPATVIADLHRRP